MTASLANCQRSYRLGDEPALVPNSFQIKLLGLPSSSSTWDYLAPIWSQLMEEVGFVQVQPIAPPSGAVAARTSLASERFRLPEVDCPVQVQWMALGPTLMVHGTYQALSRSLTFSWQWPPGLAVVTLTPLGPRFRKLDELSRAFKNAIAWPLLITCRSDLRLPLPPHTWANLPPEIIWAVLRYLDWQSVGRWEQTCRRSRDFALDANIWAHLFTRDFPNKKRPATSTPVQWKQAYRKARQ
ncbi:hypothetical protein TCAL_16387 [Tigriopus californicus]|uniref:F-box domain-containing protein n=1 Tax=Tigriopus californicus TaxID=6832 RepID=A0A553NZQ9_TIGCA|nr:uncharacterized protein LOC131887008 [Tigriopus californicus]TRY70926.1 hypothetical protein TCAL_16387 [Tigriopus californicus]